MIQIGDVYRLKAAHECGAKTVRVTGVKGDKIQAATGKVVDGDFMNTTFQCDGRPVRQVTLKGSDLADFIQHDDIQENTMINETTYEMDADAVAEADAAGEGTKRKALTFEEQKALIKEQETKRLKALEEKEKAKKKAAQDKEKEKARKEKEVADKKKKADADKVETKLRGLIEGTDFKEAELAAQFSGDEKVKKFRDLEPEAAKTAETEIKKLVKDKRAEQALALKTTLTAEEDKELISLEKTIEKALPQFQQAAFQLGASLHIINQKRLYRATKNAEGKSATFAEYVSIRFDLSRPHAYTVMAASQTFGALMEGEQVSAKDMPSLTAAEAITRGVQHLLKEANVTDDPELDSITRQVARNVFALAVQNAPVDKDGKPILSPSHLTSVFSVLNDVARTGVVEMDGEQVEINLAAASIDEMITTESSERVMRAKQFLADQFTAAASRPAPTGGSKLDKALDSATGNGAAIPEGVTPILTPICSVHGKVKIEDTTDTLIKLGCGCEFIATPDGYIYAAPVA